MILLVDVGNTNIVIGVYKDNDYIAGWRISTDSKKTSDEYGIQMIQLFNQNDLNPKEVKGIIISTENLQKSYNRAKAKEKLRKEINDYDNSKSR